MIATTIMKVFRVSMMDSLEFGFCPHTQLNSPKKPSSSKRETELISQHKAIKPFMSIYQMDKLYIT